MKSYMKLLRMAPSGMLPRVALVRTDVSEELSASLIRVTRIGELGTTLAVASDRRTLRRRATRRNIPEDDILHSHRRENLKSYIHESMSHSYKPISIRRILVCFINYKSLTKIRNILNLLGGSSPPIPSIHIV
jgi:hypothetical protein